jgi:uncharacterized protein YecT (DUF1311 family)
MVQSYQTLDHLPTASQMLPSHIRSWIELHDMEARLTFLERALGSRSDMRSGNCISREITMLALQFIPLGSPTGVAL